MVIEKLKATSIQILNRFPVVAGRGEEATKQSLILPMLDALGFDIWDPSEVCPEYDADFAIKKLGQKEKVDLAVFLGGIPRIYMEVKSAGTVLDGHQGQLARYFNATSTVSLAILTNGVEYRFFTDTGDPNLMDPSPFHVVKLDAIDQGLEILARFHKSVFSPDAIREFATRLNYTAKIANFLRNELDLREKEPSEAFVRWVLGEERSFTGRVTANVVDRFQSIVKDALQIVLRDIVRRSVAALDKEVTSAATVDDPTPAAVPSPTTHEVIPPLETNAPEVLELDDVRSRLVTTENELQLFALVKEIFDGSEFAGAEFFDRRTRKSIPLEISYKDTTGYFCIYFNRPSSWIIRSVVEGRSPWIGFNLSPTEGERLIPSAFTRMTVHPYAEFRVALPEVSSISSLSALVLAAFRKTLEDRRRDPESASEASESPLIVAP